MTATFSSVPGLYVGASGFSYPTWRGDFYPAGSRPEDFLRLYADRLPSVELNTTGYRLPAEGHFDRWAEQTPPEFRFAVKLPGHFSRQLGTVNERFARLGDRLGVVRVVVMQAADPGFLTLLFGSIDPTWRIAFDFRHASWDGVDVSPAVRVDDWKADAPFRYVRFREPPYSEEQLVGIATRLQEQLAGGSDVYAYFRHEDEPTAPRYAERVLELVGAGGPSSSKR